VECTVLLTVSEVNFMIAGRFVKPAECARLLSRQSVHVSHFSCCPARGGGRDVRPRSQSHRPSRQFLTPTPEKQKWRKAERVTQI
jgi:hypothetical protein